MAKIYTSAQDESLIELILVKGLQAKAPKWTVLRLALAKSLSISTPPEEGLKRENGKGGEYAFEQATGKDPNDVIFKHVVLLQSMLLAILGGALTKSNLIATFAYLDKCHGYQWSTSTACTPDQRPLQQREVLHKVSNN